MIDLDGIKARAKAATPGPWEPDGSEIYVAGSRDWVAESCRYEFGPDDQSRPTDAGDRDATFIAHARTDVPALVAEVERLRGELARLKSTPVAGFCSCTPIPKLRVGQFLIACETCGRMRYVDSTPTTSSKRFRVDL